MSAVAHCKFRKFEIWAMKDYDAKESWIKQFSIGIHVPSGLEQDLSQSFRDSKLYRNISFVSCLLPS